MGGLQVCKRTSLHVSDDKSRIACVDTLCLDDGKFVENPSAVVRYSLDNNLGSACLELSESGELISFGLSKTGQVIKVSSKGLKGVNIESKKLWKEKGTKVRIDIENPAPGSRYGQIHYHDINNKKYMFDFENDMFNAPKQVNKMLKK